jgi:hypothetical protein
MPQSPWPIALLAAFAVTSATAAPAPADPTARMSAQVEAMKRLSWMDGVWRGQAWTILATGERREVTQTERIGPALSGGIKVLEGRGYLPDGDTGFNAFGVLSFEPRTGAYTLHSYAMSQAGDFPLKPTADGYVWEIPLGNFSIRYTAVLKDGVWTETGERVVPGSDPAAVFFQMKLRRVSDSPWPSAGAIPPK